MSKEIAVIVKNNDTEIEVTESMIKNYICPHATQKEIFMFLKLCEAQNLNPFIGEAYLIKYGNDVQMIVGKETFLKRAENNPDFQGFEAGVITKDKDDKLFFKKGSFYCQETEKLLGGWAEVKKQNIVQPVRAEISLQEYVKKNKEGRPIMSWRTMPATMIRKVALVQALREAFPNALSACYISEELSNKDESSETPVTHEVVEEKEAVQSLKEKEAVTPPTEEGDEVDADFFEEVKEEEVAVDSKIPMVETEDGLQQTEGAVINDIKYRVKNCLTISELENLWNEQKETINSMSLESNTYVKSAFNDRKVLIEENRKQKEEVNPEFEEPEKHPEIVEPKESNSLEEEYKTKNLTALKNILRTKLHEWCDNDDEIRRFIYQHTKKEVLSRLTKPEAIKMLLVGRDEFESSSEKPIDLKNASSVVIEAEAHNILKDSLPDKQDRDTFIQNITGGFNLNQMPKHVAYDAYLKIVKAHDEMKKEEK